MMPEYREYTFVGYTIHVATLVDHNSGIFGPTLSLDNRGLVSSYCLKSNIDAFFFVMDKFCDGVIIWEYCNDAQ